jgi:hypothetical protein
MRVVAHSDQVKDRYLPPFLGEIVALVQRILGFGNVPASTGLCMVYQLLGSIEYFAISTATLTRMYGEKAYGRFRDDFPLALRSRIRRLIESHRPTANEVTVTGGSGGSNPDDD